MGKTKSKHAAGDFLFEKSTPEAKKLHAAFKKATRVRDRADFMRQRQADASQFQR